MAVWPPPPSKLECGLEPLAGMAQEMSSLTCKVQYLNDVDPFSATTKFPEPARAPTFSFNVNIPLINQIAAVHRLLKAPHRVSISSVHICY